MTAFMCILLSGASYTDNLWRKSCGYDAGTAVEARWNQVCGWRAGRKCRAQRQDFWFTKKRGGGNLVDTPCRNCFSDFLHFCQLTYNRSTSTPTTSAATPSTSTRHPLHPVMRFIFARRPLRVVGTPVQRAKRCFADVMPSARFHEKPRRR